MKRERIQNIRGGEPGVGAVVYWMQRDQRVSDNWALIHALTLGQELKKPVVVVFSLVSSFADACWRQYSFMLDGLRQVHSILNRKHIPFLILTGQPPDTVPSICRQLNASYLVTDFNPLRPQRQWVKLVCERIEIPFDQVDAHNIVPCRQASNKQEFAARTFRPKIRAKLWEYMDDFPERLPVNRSMDSLLREPDWNKLRAHLSVDFSVEPLDWIQPGERKGLSRAKSFIKNRLNSYKSARNDPNQSGQSNLSPYLHFGQISAQRVARMVLDSDASQEQKDAFIEELVVRRELSDNFCYYNQLYDSPEGFPDWAKLTLENHKQDARPHTYSRKQLETAKTGDPLWNAAQNEMVVHGKMHGYMRMYWAKKILEWSDSVEKALRWALYLNDKYELDGRDPNGYVGCAWSIGGVHDRAWPRRSVYGKIRYMSYNGARKKFDVNKYIEQYAAKSSQRRLQ